MAPLDLSLMHVRSRTSPRIESPGSLRVFGCLPGAGARGCTEAGVRKASREETAGKLAPAVVSGYGELAPVFDLIFHFRTGTAAERVPANINAFTKTRSFIQPIGLI